jgi:hypothetical protein
MSLPPTYSRRKRVALSSGTDVYEYEKFSGKLRRQIVQIVQDTIGHPNEYSNPDPAIYYARAVKVLREEKGVFSLVRADEYIPINEEFLSWVQSEPDVDTLLDGVEIMLQAMEGLHGRYGADFRLRGATTRPADGIAKINARMMEEGVGYQFADGEIIRMDNEIVHREAVVPALILLRDPRFAAANEEYRNAHAAYRAADYETSIIQCAKSFESVLKVIGGERGWEIDENDPASKLISAAFKAEFIPSYLETEFTGLRVMLESSVPVVRNKSAGHGAGKAPRQVPAHLAAFQIQQTAVVIQFLVQHHSRTPMPVH